jgi:branched-chain amino acid transport system ATP-binding protein
MTQAAPILSVTSLEKRFGGLVALHGVSFTAAKGDITAVIGPNGAGKTTLFNCVTGMYQPSGGSVSFEGRDLTGAKPHVVARAGIARTFQNLALFHGLSVQDNLVVGHYQHGRSGLLQGAFRSPRSRRDEREAQEKAREVLDFLGLSDVAAAVPSELPYGRQKQVEFGRALMQDARLILLDEPMAGMSRVEKSQMVELIRRVRDGFDVSVVIVEHDMPVIMEISDRIVVLDFGRKIADGTPREVRENKTVIAAYLGADA